MVLQSAQREFEDKHHARPFHDGTWTSWSDKWSPEFRYHYSDGQRIWVADSDYDPSDNWLT